MNRRVLTRLAAGLLTAVLVYFAGSVLVRNWSDVRADVGRIAWHEYVLSFACTLGGCLLFWAGWASAFKRFDTTRLPARQSMAIFFVGQIGKYVPGSVWPALLQGRFAKRAGLRQSAMIVSWGYWAGLLVAAGGVTSVLTLGAPLSVAHRILICCAAACSGAAVVVLVHPRILPAALGSLSRRLKRSVTPLPDTGDAGVRSVLLSLCAWILLGVHAWFLARPLGADAADLPVVIGAFALSFTAGIVAVPVPAGAGLRESVLILVLGPQFGDSTAVLIALLSRFLLVIADVVLAATCGLVSLSTWRAPLRTPAAD